MEKERILTRIDEIRTFASRELLARGISIPSTYPSSFRASKGQRLASYFDHTLLKPEANKESIDQLCKEAVLWKTCSVSVPPNRVRHTKALLEGTEVRVGTVVGFPMGYSESKSKAEEVQVALKLGCSEFDTVIPIGLLKDGNIPAVFEDIHAVVKAAEGRIVKAILEMFLLTEEEKLLGGIISLWAGCHMLETSTGFASRGATVDDISLLRLLCGKSHGVKASGGIRDFLTVQSMIEAGADRIGASSTPSILSEAEGRVR